MFGEIVFIQKKGILLNREPGYRIRIRTRPGDLNPDPPETLNGQIADKLTYCRRKASAYFVDIPSKFFFFQKPPHRTYNRHLPLTRVADPDPNPGLFGRIRKFFTGSVSGSYRYFGNVKLYKPGKNILKIEV